MKDQHKKHIDNQINSIKGKENAVKNQDYNANMELNPDVQEDVSTPKLVCRLSESDLPAKLQGRQIEFVKFLEACVEAEAISYQHHCCGFDWVVFNESEYRRICQEYGYSDSDFETEICKYPRRKHNND